MPYIHGKSIIKIAVADNLDMFRELVSTYIDSIENCKVVIQAANGRELLEKISIKPNTDLILLDISMPDRDGYEVAKELKEKHPEIKILFYSRFNSEMAICRMIRVGGNGYIHKGATLSELRKAFYELMKNGQYFPRIRNINARTSVLHKGSNDMNVSDEELEFLRLAGTEKIYDEIALDMGLSLRQVEYIREKLFIKFDVHCRVGMVLTAFKSGILSEILL